MHVMQILTLGSILSLDRILQSCFTAPVVVVNIRVCPKMNFLSAEQREEDYIVHYRIL